MNNEVAVREAAPLMLRDQGRLTAPDIIARTRLVV